MDQTVYLPMLCTRSRLVAPHQTRSSAPAEYSGPDRLSPYCVQFNRITSEKGTFRLFGQAEVAGWRPADLPVPRDIDDTEEQRSATKVYLSINKLK